AWLAITFTVAARLVQLAIVLSMVYVGYLAWHGARVIRRALRRAASGAGVPTGRADGLPWVTIVVPARDEADVIEGLLADLAALRYHDEQGRHFDVLVVDDGSTDTTATLARAATGVTVVQRPPDATPRTKAAVLAFVMPYVRGDVLAVLDADARVAPDLIERTMRAWPTGEPVAAVQVQRRPYNADAGWLPGAQADEQLMDLASQCGRWVTDGTAELRGNGMFVRRDALQRVGGWDPLALTEDLDLSTRLVAAGDEVALAPAAVVGEEAVTSLAALWGQRLRWAEGSLRRLLEHGPRLVAGALPLGRKLDFLAFVGEFVIPPLFVITLVAALVNVSLGGPADWTVPVSLFAAYGAGTFLLALAGLAADGVRGLPLLGRSARGALFLSHWLLVVPAALLRITVAPRTTTFSKTPRSRMTDR
ncbi:MAG TPA: glycosyltransferase family 2 protein, partial [Candidatus Limnocylindria bacterium]|nr:glycosyltransferase family 2 protein [Candidatus Limnocylindria bacterium]